DAAADTEPRHPASGPSDKLRFGSSAAALTRTCMSEANKALTKRWFEEVWNKRRREAIDEMLSPHAVLYEAGKIAKGPEGFRPFFDRMWEAFSDIQITVQD